MRMATLAEFTIPAGRFPLGSIFDRYPEVTVELERVIPTNTTIVPYFWVHDAGEATEEAIEASFRPHPDFESISLVDRIDSENLLRVTWAPEYQGVLRAIVETDVVLLSGTGTAEEWTFEVRANERDATAEFQEYCTDHGVPIELTAVHEFSKVVSGTEYDLTEAQREALVLAYEEGYYQAPRETGLDALADELGITGQALGSRLRRGIQNLIGSTLDSANRGRI